MDLATLATFLGIFRTYVAIYFSNRNIKKQIRNSPQIAKDYLPTLLELLENLDILKEGLLYKGKLCPIIEHRCPTLSANDGEADYSYSQRAHIFFVAGKKAINNCREIIFLTPAKEIPEIKKKVKEIKEFFMERNPGKKDTLEQIQQCLLSTIAEEDQHDRSASKSCSKFYDNISAFYRELDELIEVELPKLRKV